MTVIWISVRLALAGLAMNALRSALTVSGVAIGILSLIVTMGIGSGFQAGVDDELAALGTDILRIEPKTPATDRRSARRAPDTLSYRDALLAEGIPSLRFAVPVRTARVFVRHAGSGSDVQVVGSTPELADILRLRTKAGRMLEMEDSGAKTVVLGARVAAFLSPGNQNAIVGSEILVAGVPVTAVGVLAAKGPTAGLDPDNAILTSFDTLRGRLAGGSVKGYDRVDGILIAVNGSGNRDAVATDLRDLIRATHRIAPADDADFAISDLAAAASAQDRILSLVRVFLLFVAVMCLSMGGIGIMNMMLVSVTERTREIGLRLAIGARRGEIVCQFLLEAVALTAIGGIAGLAFGLPTGHQLALLADQAFTVSFDLMAAAFGFSLATGVVFGLYPAVRAARLSPIEALRHV